MNANTFDKNIIVLGNPHSPHISVWISALENVNLLVDKIAINHGTHIPLLEKNFQILFSKPWLRSFPKTLMYFLGGIFLFFRYMFKSNVVIHAHCASGYGLMAFLSGKKYALTTYGSEIFDKDRKSFLYNIMIKMVLERAHLISASTPAMENFLIDQYKIKKSRIRTFSLGDSNEFLNPASQERIGDSLSSFLKRYEFIFFSNRRITSHYNIDYIMDEFETLLSLNPPFKGECGLLILSGDCDQESFEKVNAHIASQKLQNNIMVINKFIDKGMMSSILENVSVTISMAKTDQLSASILEAISKEVPPVLNKLDAYADIQKFQCGIFLESMNPGVLAGCLNKIVCKKYDLTIYEKMKKYVSSFLEKKVINNQIIKFYHEFIHVNLDES